MEKKEDSLIHCSDDKEDAALSTDPSEENGLVLENQENHFDLNLEPPEFRRIHPSSSTPAVDNFTPPFSFSASTQNNNLVVAMPENSIAHDDLQTSSPITNTNTNSNRSESDSIMKKAKVEKWAEEEHKNFLAGLGIYGKGKWKEISQNMVNTKTPKQVASHAQKYFKRQGLPKEMHKRPSINDVNTVDDGYVKSLAPNLQKEASQFQPNSNSVPDNTNTNSNTSESDYSDHLIQNYSGSCSQQDRVLDDDYVKSLAPDLQKGASQSQPNSNSVPENTNTNSNTSESESHSIQNYSKDRVLADKYVKTLAPDLQTGASQSQPNSNSVPENTNTNSNTSESESHSIQNYSEDPQSQPNSVPLQKPLPSRPPTPPTK